MKHLILAAAISVGVTGTSLAQDASTHGTATQAIPSTASAPMPPSNRADVTDRTAQAANQFIAEGDARTAGVKADLHLTAEQDKNWSVFESSLHDIYKNRAARMVAFQGERGQHGESADVIEYLNSNAKALDERSADMKKLADAARPLYASLEPQQKRQFASELIHLSRE